MLAYLGRGGGVEPTMYSCECYASRGGGAAVRALWFEAELWTELWDVYTTSHLLS